MPLVELTAPANEAVSLTEVKNHLRIVGSEEDTYLTAILKAARIQAEIWTGRAIMRRTFEQYHDRFPALSTIQIERPPLISVSAVEYIAQNAAVYSTLSSALYTVDTSSAPGRVYLLEGNTWPVTEERPNAVKISFTAGQYTATADVPVDLKQGILLLVGHLYAHREIVLPGVSMVELPKSFEWLLGPYRVYFK